jgi:hypothetical protein
MAGARADDRIGGSTFTFTLDAGHPDAEEVYGLLRELRGRVQGLWDRVSTYNTSHPPDEESATRVTFYMGQSLEVRDEPDESNLDAPAESAAGSTE